MVSRYGIGIYAIDGMKCYTDSEIENALKAGGFTAVETKHHTKEPWLTVIAKIECDYD